MTVVAKRNVSAATPPLRFLPDDLSRTAFENKALTLFWDLYLPKGDKGLFHSSIIGPRSQSWTEIVRDLNLDDRTLRPALLAVCLARIGESKKDPPLIQQGIKQYGKALLEMNQALHDKNRAQTDEVLATGKLMAAYEVCNIRDHYLRSPGG